MLLKQPDTINLVNSVHPAIPLSEKRLRTHIRSSSGAIQGKDGWIDLGRYIVWLMTRYKQRAAARAEAYEKTKARTAERAAAAARAAQEIGDLPEVFDPERKERCRLDYREFCECYFGEVFYLPWSKDHLRAIEKIEQAVLNGDKFALAMPRGSGKTTLCKIAVLWAALYGHHQFISLIASSAEKARDLLDGIKVWIETNEHLLEDFPEVCYPIKCLERIASRQSGQRYHGIHTRIEWVTDHIVFPTIEGSAGSGVVIFTAGMKGSEIRGQQITRPDGTVVRPSLFLLDDPQTTESAWSNSQCLRREQAISGDILGMAGPGKKIAGLITATVIRPGDLADVLLDREKHPDWKGERFKLVYSFPTDEKLWEEYAQVRRDELKNDGDGSLATAFYAEHREEMDAGAEVAWAERFSEGELSAIQHAMNLKFRDETAFYAEYQNEPIKDETLETFISEDEVAGNLNGTPRRIVPEHVQHITAFIDVQKDVLFYLVAGWENDFTGYVLDYGTWPGQAKAHFNLRNLTETLTDRYPRTGFEGSIRAGLTDLVGELLGRRWLGVIPESEYSIEKLLIDANWGASTDVVYEFCRSSSYAAILMPSHGKYVGASSTPFAEYKRKRGDVIGHHWMIPSMTGKRAVRHILIDTNFWKTFVTARLSTRVGDAGSLTLFGNQPLVHQLLAEHFTAEYFVPTEAKNASRVVNEWKVKPNRSDNHWFDCMVGSAVAASMLGVSLRGTVSVRPQGRSGSLRLSDLQKEKRGGIPGQDNRGGRIRLSDIQNRKGR